jgi:hypothetical protein
MDELMFVLTRDVTFVVAREEDVKQLHQPVLRRRQRRRQRHALGAGVEIEEVGRP